ncbi:MAG: SEC-C domain-containing protein [Candidatus Schekmanbacteria bacterium]|nr:SEC-C domain-containing protein [Candidatus Schekmanbacteria bacterium]
MSILSRNELCRCGSGKKYKKCCLAKDDAVNLQILEDTRLMEAVELKLLNFTETRQETLKIKEEVENALVFYNGLENLESLEQKELEELLEDPEFFNWFKFDFKLKSGQTLMNYFLEQNRESLTPEELTMAEIMLGSYPSLYLILELYPHQGYKVKDLVNDREIIAYNKSVSAKDSDDVVISARLVIYQGRHYLLDIGYYYPSAIGEILAGATKEVIDSFNKDKEQNYSVPEFLKNEGYWYFNWLYFTLQEIMAGEDTATESEDAYIDYRVLDYQAARSALSTLAGVQDITEDTDEINAEWVVNKTAEGEDESDEYYNDIFLTNDTLTLACDPDVQEISQDLLTRHFARAINTAEPPAIHFE